MTKPQGPEQRQRAITELVTSQGTVSAGDLAELFGVSVMTVHRDLDELQARGVLRKSRGAATALPTGVFESNVSYRLKANVEAKRELAAAAVRHVEPGMSIMLDDSTTVLQMVPLLAEHAPLQVATNFLEAMRQLAPMRGIGLIGLGGTFDDQHESFLGLNCVRAIESLMVDVLFVSTSAVHQGYAFHQEESIVAVKRAMLASARQRILLLDHTKFARLGLYRLARLTDFDLVVVDAHVPTRDVEELRLHGVALEVAGEL